MRPRLAAYLTALSLMVGVSACGDSGDDDAAAGRQPTADKPPSAPAPSAKRGGAPVLTGDRRQAAKGAAAVDRVYRGLGSAADAGVASIDVPVEQTLSAAEDNVGLVRMCDLMSARAKRQTIVFADRSAGLAGVDWTCEKATGVLLRRTRQLGGLKRSLQARIVRVDAQGNRADVTIRFGGEKGSRSNVALVKEGGKWKLAATPGS